MLVEVTGLEPVTLCRLVHDEPSCKKAKKKHSSYNECSMVDLKGIEPSTSRMRTERSPKLSYKPEYMLSRKVF